jgi:hypothetical protein
MVNATAEQVASSPVRSVLILIGETCTRPRQSPTLP